MWWRNEEDRVSTQNQLLQGGNVFHLQQATTAAAALNRKPQNTQINNKVQINQRGRWARWCRWVRWYRWARWVRWYRWYRWASLEGGESAACWTWAGEFWGSFMCFTSKISPQTSSINIKEWNENDNKHCCKFCLSLCRVLDQTVLDWCIKIWGSDRRRKSVSDRRSCCRWDLWGGRGKPSFSATPPCQGSSSSQKLLLFTAEAPPLHHWGSSSSSAAIWRTENQKMRSSIILLFLIISSQIPGKSGDE